MELVATHVLSGFADVEPDALADVERRRAAELDQGLGDRDPTGLAQRDDLRRASRGLPKWLVPEGRGLVAVSRRPKGAARCRR
jgi:hypothetical protein